MGGLIGRNGAIQRNAATYEKHDFTFPPPTSAPLWEVHFITARETRLITGTVGAVRCDNSSGRSRLIVRASLKLVVCLNITSPGSLSHSCWTDTLLDLCYSWVKWAKLDPSGKPCASESLVGNLIWREAGVNRYSFNGVISDGSFSPARGSSRTNYFNKYSPLFHSACLCSCTWSAPALKPQTGEMKTMDYLIAVAPVKGVGFIRQRMNSQFFELMRLKQEEYI